jgi:outer membrane receptor for ferrienterochelin and colicin
LPGFKTFVQRDISVGLNASVVVNIKMEVGEIASTVDVTASRSAAILEQGPSVGDVLTQERIQSLPVVGNNVLDLLEILPGIRISGAGSQYDRVGGLGIDEINVTRDGITVSDSRFQAGQTSAFQTDASGT